MKQSVLHTSSRILFLGLMVALAPLNAARAQSYDDQYRTEPPAGFPSESERTPPETTPPGESTRPNYQDQQATQPRGAMGPVRSDTREELSREKYPQDTTPVVPKVITNPNDSNPNNY